MDEYIEILVEKVSSELTTKKDNLLKDKLAELGIKIDLEIESKKRFKSLVRESQGYLEHIYFNDGSEEGQKIITFVHKPIVNDQGLFGYSIEHY